MFYFAAVPTQYGSQTINAWGGPGFDTVSMTAYDFISYLPTPDHPGRFKFGYAKEIFYLSRKILLRLKND